MPPFICTQTMEPALAILERYLALLLQSAEAAGKTKSVGAQSGSRPYSARVPHQRLLEAGDQFPYPQIAETV